MTLRHMIWFTIWITSAASGVWFSTSLRFRSNSYIFRGFSLFLMAAPFSISFACFHNENCFSNNLVQMHTFIHNLNRADHKIFSWCLKVSGSSSALCHKLTEFKKIQIQFFWKCNRYSMEYFLAILFRSCCW